MSQEKKVLLELKKLKKYFPVRRGVQIKALEDVSFSIYEGEKFGVVGESGCGKSTLGRVILQLLSLIHIFLRLYHFLDCPQDVTAALVEAGVALFSAENKNTTLEDYFLSLIGGVRHG